MSVTRESLQTGNLVYLLVITFAGREWRWATDYVEAEDASGRRRPFRGGLDCEFTEQLQIGRTVTPRSVPLSLIWPESINRLMEAGHDLGAATGELSMWIEGDPWEERTVLLQGIVADPVVADDDEPVEFSLEEWELEDHGLLVDPEAMVTALTWPDAPIEGKGTRYPTVFGCPGPITEADGTDSKVGATPARLVKSTGGVHYLLIAGHPTLAGTNAESVYINNQQLAEWQSILAIHVADDLGRVCTVVDAHALFTRGTDPWSPAHAYACSWGPSAGGIQRRENLGVAEGAGSVFALALARSSQRVDWPRTWAAVPQLERFKLAGYWDRGTATQALDELLPLLPVALCRSAQGVYPWVWRWDAPASEAVAHLVDGEGGVEFGPSRYEGREDAVNEITFDYAYGRQRETWQRRKILTGDVKLRDEPDYVVTTAAANSRTTYGVRRKSIQSKKVFADLTVTAMLAWMSAAKGSTHRILSVGAEEQWAWLRPGDLVTFDVPRRGIEGAVGWIRTVVRRSGLVGFEIFRR